MTDLEYHRQAKDHAFKYSADSPIPWNDRAAFTGLDYYPERPDLRFVVPLEPIADAAPVEMVTSTGDNVAFQSVGRVTLTIAGQPVHLTVYASEYGDLFLPFRDATSGQTTYGGGRYLEPEWAGPNQVVIDFNLAYNPYCAYSDAWSCPLPPPENTVPVPIEAGERNYRKPGL